MSANYYCDICKKNLPEHEHKNKRDFEVFTTDNMRIIFTVDFAQWLNRGICEECAIKKIKEGIKIFHKEYKKGETK